MTITFNQVEGMPGSRIVDTVELIFDPHGSVDLDWLNAEIEGIFLQEPDPTSGIRYQRDPFVSTQTRGHHSWGAESAAVQFVIETAAYIGQEGASALVGAGILHLVQMLTKRGFAVVMGGREHLTDDEASRFGLRLIESEYDVDLPALSLRSIGTNDRNQYVCTAADAQQITYSVTFTVGREGDTKLVSRNRDLP